MTQTNKLWRGLVLLGLMLALTGCLFGTHRSMAPLPDETKAELAAKGLKVGAPLFVRIFKLENEMEVWLKNDKGTYTKFRTYPICNWSGDIGPKTKQGDRQAPEGFYVVTAKQMNPNSSYYLSFNLGYPNTYDQAHGYTGSLLMVHGGCRSAGCYAITDDAIAELFTLGREAFTAGQRQFPVNAYPFRMTEENLAFRAGNKWEPFWRNLAEGYRMFEKTHIPPVVGVQDGRYVFYQSRDQVPAGVTVSPASAGGAALISGWQ